MWGHEQSACSPVYLQQQEGVCATSPAPGFLLCPKFNTAAVTSLHHQGKSGKSLPSLGIGMPQSLEAAASQPPPPSPEEVP